MKITSIRSRLLFSALVVAPFVLVACQGAGTSDTQEQIPASQAATPLSAAGAALTAFRLHLPQSGSAELADRGSGLAAVLLGQSTSSASIASAIGKGAIPATGIAVAIPEAPQVKLGHRPALAETLVLNEVVSRDTTSPLDVGEGVARSTFAGAFGALVRGGLVDGKGLDVTAPKLSQIVQGEGVVGQSPSERVKEYIYTVPRKVNGVGVFGAGVEVSVHRTNRLSKISTFGPTVISTVAKDGSEIPDGSGYNFVRAVPSGDLLARANAENAGATVQPLGLQYVLPEGASDAVVEPTEVYFVVPTMTVDGRTLHGRAHLVAYSVSNKAAASVVWPRPAVGAKGDPNK